jgi:ubiquitin carboxyl-terminal hydrolase 25/28
VGDSWSDFDHLLLGYVFLFRLGLHSISTNPELLAFGYLAQCRCDPAYTVDYFTSFYNIVKTMQDLGHASQELQSIVMDERTRLRYTVEDQERAIQTLGFGKDGHLGVDFEPDVPEEFIADAWRHCVRRAWHDTENGVAIQREATEAFRIAAEKRESVKLWSLWESGKGTMMNPERAYETLEIPKEVDDTMLLTVFLLRVRRYPVTVCGGMMLIPLTIDAGGRTTKPNREDEGSTLRYR